jgi:hypothetical protein
MTFRKFTEYGAASRTQITIRVSNLLFISYVSFKEFNKDSRFAEIYIDESNYMIGIKFLLKKDSEKTSRKIMFEKAGITININWPLKYFGIKKLKRKYISDYKKQDDMIVFSIFLLKS